MRLATCLPIYTILIHIPILIVKAQYTLQTDYFQTDFFDSFDFFNGPDPTHGFVQYTGLNEDLISSSTSNAQMRVSTEQSTPEGRPSIRITSTESYETGLIILDLEHMPGGICGTWPAFWTFGPNWPAQGEIDIIEGVNDDQTNTMTLHTGSTCSIAPSNMIGNILADDCDVSDGAGCGITTTDSATYGSDFNSNGGGVYATLFTGSDITIWFWSRDSVPADILNNSPNPLTWSTPLANFSGSCDFENSFVAQHIVFDTTFCGDWAGKDWPNSGCAAKAATCDEYVGNNGADFEDAYWSINGLKVYQASGASQSIATSATPSASASTASIPPAANLTTSTSSSLSPTILSSVLTLASLSPSETTVPLLPTTSRTISSSFTPTFSSTSSIITTSSSALTLSFPTPSPTSTPYDTVDTSAQTATSAWTVASPALTTFATSTRPNPSVSPASFPSPAPVPTSRILGRPFPYGQSGGPPTQPYAGNPYGPP